MPKSRGKKSSSNYSAFQSAGSTTGARAKSVVDRDKFELQLISVRQLLFIPCGCGWILVPRLRVPDP